jgi:hypothetical protein
MSPYHPVRFIANFRSLRKKHTAVPPFASANTEVERIASHVDRITMQNPRMVMR